VSGSAFDTNVKNYVFTRRPAQSAASAGVEFVNELIKTFTTRLQAKKGKDIWMMGALASLRRFWTKERSTSS
jgi:dihydrofolate reductase